MSNSQDQASVPEEEAAAVPEEEEEPQQDSVPQEEEEASAPEEEEEEVSVPEQEAAPAPEEEEEAPERQHSYLPPYVLVIFINTTERPINVRWLRPNGTYHDYGDIPKKGFIYCVTQYGHKWAFFDTKDGELLRTSFNSSEYDKEYFAAKLPSCYEEGQESPRQYVFIHLRMHSLSYLALKAVAETHPNYQQLQLPKHVIEALDTYCDKKEYFLEQWRRDVASRVPRRPLRR